MQYVGNSPCLVKENGSSHVSTAEAYCLASLNSLADISEHSHLSIENLTFNENLQHDCWSTAQIAKDTSFMSRQSMLEIISAFLDTSKVLI